MCECGGECMCCDDPDLKVFIEGEGKLEAPRTGDAGFDLYTIEDLELKPQQQVLASTGLKIAVPEGWVGIVKDRSSVALQQVYTHAGVIDASYRGEVKILLMNHSAETKSFPKGAKIAQLVVVPSLTGCVKVACIEDLGETVRGEKGFGSTGK